MNIKKIKTIFATSLVVSVAPIYFVACGQQETISKVSIQNITSTSAQLILSNVSKVKVGDKDDFGKLDVQLKTEGADYKSIPITNQLIGRDQNQVIITIDNLKPNTKYVAKIFQQLPTENVGKELFFRDNIFTTKDAPQINNFKVVPVNDKSSEYSFDATITDNKLTNQLITIRIAKTNQLSNDKYISQSFVNNQENDGLIHIRLTNLDRATNYKVIGFYDSQGKSLRFEPNDLLNFQTSSDVIDLKLLPPNPNENAIDSKLENIRQYFEVQFARGIVNSSNVSNYKLIFKAKTKPLAPEYIKKSDENKDQEFVAEYNRAGSKDNSYVFVVNLPWRKGYYYFLTSIHNQFISDSKQYDPNNKNSTNSLEIDPSILKTSFQIDNPEAS